jgi:hypothetical protein
MPRTFHSRPWRHWSRLPSQRPTLLVFLHDSSLFDAHLDHLLQMGLYALAYEQEQGAFPRLALQRAQVDAQGFRTFRGCLSLFFNLPAHIAAFLETHSDIRRVMKLILAFVVYGFLAIKSIGDLRKALLKDNKSKTE